ncbi:MAG: DUF362 domain-containing protein [Bacilli bacterium]|nr:DUF362 domain-containing protein [Bacilli bacterium]
MEKAKVYFTKEITPERVVKMYEVLGINLPGKVAVKVHSGEKGNQNYLHPEFMRPMIEHVNGTVVECNTAYPGARNDTEHHKELMEEHGWSKYFNVDIMDSEGPDLEFSITNGDILDKNYVGKNIKNYDSLLVLSHFKGHPAGGFGGSLKQLSIGCASTAGKVYIHTAGKTTDQSKFWDYFANQEDFTAAMAESASTIMENFKDKAAYINVMCNLSVDCDCCEVAEDPCMADIGILSSLDPVALDQACVDLVYNSKDPGRDHLVERIERQNGVHILEVAEKLGIGSREYELIDIDNV